jgi:hypothetical protein
MTNLITLDATLLGERIGPTLATLLTDASPIARFAPDLVTDAVHRMESAPLSEDLVATVRDRLLIDPTHWPTSPPPTGIHLSHHIRDVMAALATLAPVAVIARLDGWTGPPLLAALRTALADLAVSAHPTFAWRIPAPSTRLWYSLAGEHHTTVDQIIHIGPDILVDVYAPLLAGARAIHLHPTSTTAPPELPVIPHQPGRTARATTLPDAVSVIRGWLS